jgi:osmotically-inducible protein OsmY
MKIKNTVAILIVCIVTSFEISSCKQKTTDTDIQSSVSAKLPSGVSSSVNGGVVILSGECRDEACKTNAELAAKEVKGVKSVINNITLAVIGSQPVEISSDETLRSTVADAIRAFQGVKADVKDGVVTLIGEIKRSDLQNLMTKVNELKPKKVDNSKLVIK